MPKKEQEVEISAKSTKDQILSAYHNIIARLEEKDKQEDPVVLKQYEEANNTVSKASLNTREAILSDLGNLKIKLLKEIDNVNEQLVNEFERLSTIRNAITIEQKHLEELYGIKENLHSFSGILIAQKEQKEKFDQDMQSIKEALENEIKEKKTQWQQQQDQLEMQHREEEENRKKNRAREDEEYKYSLELLRRKEQDEYNFKKTELEKELNQKILNIENREAIVANNEEKIKDLELKVTNFQDDIDKAVQEAEAKLREILETEHHHLSILKDKEFEMINKLNSQQVHSLQQKIQDQDILIKDLTIKANVAAEQVQSIACKALDASSQRFNIHSNDPKIGEKTS